MVRGKGMNFDGDEKNENLRRPRKGVRGVRVKGMSIGGGEGRMAMKREQRKGVGET